MKVIEMNDCFTGWRERLPRQVSRQSRTPKMSFGLSYVFLVCLMSSTSFATPNPQAGRTYARVNCSQCHSIDKTTPSSLSIAPPFRTFHEKYPVESLAEALAEGIVTGHPSMPEFRLDPGQIDDLINFLRSLGQ